MKDESERSQHRLPDRERSVPDRHPDQHGAHMITDHEEQTSQRTVSGDRPSKAPVATGAALAGHNEEDKRG